MMRQALWSLAIALGLLVAGCGPARTAAPDVPVFDSDRMTITVTGTGPPVILVPGLASADDVWDGVIAALDQTHSLHAVQIHGFAGVPADGNGGSEDLLQAWSGDLADYARTLDEPPALVGHSLGGVLALKTALKDDSVVDRVMVVDALPYFSVMIDEAATPETMKPMATLAEATLLAQPEDVFASRQGEILTTLIKTRAHDQRVLGWSVASDRSVMARAMAEVMVTDLRADMAGLDVPLTVIYARDPAIADMETVEALYRQDYAPAPELRLVPMDDAFHFVMLDQPDAFVAELRTFLEGGPE